MKNKKELMNELKEKFEAVKKNLGFKAVFEDIDNYFFIKDAVLEVGFVSDSFERQLCLRMVTTYYSWIDQLHAWLNPGMTNMITNNETKYFNEQDREKMKILISKAMYFLRKDKLNGIKKDNAGMGNLIDEMVSSRNDFFKTIGDLHEKTTSCWNEELDQS